MSDTIQLPLGLTPDQVRAIMGANKGTVFAAPMPPGAVAPADVSGDRILGWLDALEAPLEAGESILLPPPIGLLLSGLTKTMLGAWRAKLTSKPLTERWTIAQMQAERDSLPVPKT